MSSDCEHSAPQTHAGSDARLLLVEDHALIRQSLIELIARHTGHEITAATGSGREAVSLAADLQPDLVIMDFRLGEGLEGLDLIKALVAVCPEARLLILSAEVGGERAEAAIRCGAHRLVSKSAPPEELFSAINSLLLDPSPSPILPIALEAPGPLADLSDRERTILRLIAAGYAIREIAADLGISRKTVEAHRSNIRTKLDFASSDALRRFARDYYRVQDNTK